MVLSRQAAGSDEHSAFFPRSITRETILCEHDTLCINLKHMVWVVNIFSGEREQFCSWRSLTAHWWYFLCPVARTWWGSLLNFKANMFLHYSCVDRTANLQFYRHACRAARGHPHSLSSHSKRCTYTNNIQSGDLWKSQIYFYKQHGLHCSSWEQKKPAKDTTHRNKRVWMSSVLSLQTSHQTHQTGSLRPHLERQLKHDVCGMREIYICECRHRSYFSPDIWLQMEPTEKNNVTYTTSTGLLVMDASHRNWWSNEY